MCSMWTMFKHVILCSRMVCFLPRQPSLEGCAVHGTEFLEQLFLLGLVRVPSFYSPSSFGLPSRIFLSLPRL